MAKKTKKRSKKIYKFFSILLVLVSLVFVLSLIYFNILPIVYQMIAVGAVVLFDLILILIMLFGKKKKTSLFFSFIMIIVYSILSFFILRTAGLLNNLNLNYKIYNYSVVVLKDSNYDKLEDIDGESLGYYKTEGEECKKSLNKISKKIDTENKSFDDVQVMAGDLLNGSIQAMLIENTYLDILDEEDGTTSGSGVTKNNEKEVDLTGFKSKTKVIYSFTIIVRTGDISKDLDVTKKPFSIYVSGIDTYGEVASVSRSDVNMVITVNPKTRQILLTSIPRDYYVKLHGKSGYPDKLTHAGLYGVDVSLKTIEDLLDIDINYYVKVNFSSVIDIVDAIGGVSVYSDYTFTSLDGYNYTKGYNQVDGKEALSFARERKSFSDGDRQRIKDQQALLEAMFRKCTSPSIITKYNSLLNSLKGSFVTNMPTDRLTSLIRMQLSKKYKWTITGNSLDGSNSSNYTYSYSASKLYVMEPDLDSVEYAKKLIEDVINGEKLDPTYDGNTNDAHKVTSSSKNSSSSNNSSTNNKTDNSNNTKNTEGLKASIGKSTVTFDEGNTYTYYKYSVTYNGEDVYGKANELFSINGKTFDNYKDLVSYVSSLKAGTYNIVYRISYSGSSTSLNQTVVINPSSNVEEPDAYTEDIQEDDSSDIEEDNN